MLEPYAVKVASTVLRRGRAGNRSFLFDYLFAAFESTAKAQRTQSVEVYYKNINLRRLRKPRAAAPSAPVGARVRGAGEVIDCGEAGYRC
jgi:hypothetical protein